MQILIFLRYLEAEKKLTFIENEHCIASIKSVYMIFSDFHPPLARRGKEGGENHKVKSFAFR